MATRSLRSHLVEELNDLLSAEHQLVQALPQMEAKASRRELKAAFRKHLAETRGHAQRVEQALRALGEKPSETKCEAMAGLLEEGKELMNGGEGALRDAMMITAAQKVEHYEIATYGTVRTYAQILGEKQVARLMAATLKEEKAADRKLTTIAVGGVNAKAAREVHETSGTDVLEKSAAWVGRGVGSAVRTARNMLPRLAASDAATRAMSTLAKAGRMRRKR
jgi:ferritin-like metal-binding protein YciE